MRRDFHGIVYHAQTFTSLLVTIIPTRIGIQELVIASLWQVRWYIGSKSAKLLIMSRKEAHASGMLTMSRLKAIVIATRFDSCHLTQTCDANLKGMTV